MSKTRPRGFAPWRPQAKTRQLLDQVISVLADYEAHLPLTVRQIFYALVGRASYSKTEKAYGRLCEALNRARRAGLVSFDVIRDDGVSRYGSKSWAGVDAFVAEVRDNAWRFRLDRQTGQPVRMWLLCEAAGMAPQLARAADEYGVDVLTRPGFDSTSLKHDLARELADNEAATEILHIGDHDPSGVHVFRALAEDIAEMTLGLGGAEPTFSRLAVTPAQARDLNLPSAPPKLTDRRSFDGNETWQAEAIPPDVLAEIVRDAIVSRQDEEIRERLLIEENDARAELLEYLEGKA